MADEWACPRCTLLNPVDSDICEVCEFNRNTQRLLSADETNDDTSSFHQNHLQLGIGEERKLMIRFEHLNPLVANNVLGSTTTIASSTLVGSLLGGPVGAIIAAASAVALDGASRFNYHMNQNPQRSRPHFVWTRTTMNGSEMAITMKTGPRCRKIFVQPTFFRRDPTSGEVETMADDRYWTQLTPRDLRMMQLLLLHLLSDTSVPENEVLYLSQQELIERVTGESSSEPKRGATPECIEENSTVVTLQSDEAVAELKESEKVCNICLEDFKKGDSMRVLNHCSHSYHTECIDQWLSKVASCPVCKHELHTAD